MKNMNRIFFQIVALAIILSCAFSNAFAQGSMCINAYMIQEESCNPGNDGKAAVFIPTALEGRCTIEWQLGPGQTSSSELVSGLTRGTYHVTVRSSVCPSVVFYSGSVAISRNEECEVKVHISTATSETANCNEVPPVNCTATASGGTPPYTFPGWNQVSSSMAKKTIYPGEGHFSVNCIARDANGIYGIAEVDGYAKKMDCAQDPNEIKGPAGYDEEERFVNGSDKMNYTIDFENDPEFAMAPASRVKITYDVPDRQRLASFRLADFGFGDFVFTVPSNVSSYSQRLDVADSLGVWVDVSAGIDIANNQVFWIFQSIDPATGAEPASSQMGFLPINDSLNHGQGYVSFYIAPATNVHTGDTVAAEAIIVFDDNAPIGTNVWTNTFDAVAPSSVLHLETSTSDSLYCTFSFDAQDDNLGSGVRSAEVYVSINNADYFSLGSVAPDSTFTYALENGIYYQFMSIATDNVGNKEPFKSVADTAINYNTAPIDLILSGNSFYEYDPVNTLIGTLYTLDNDVNLPFVYELVTGEGDDDNGLFVIEGNMLRTNASFTCSRRTEYSVRIRTTDIGGLYFEKSFDLNEVLQHVTPHIRLNKSICEGGSIEFGSRVLTEAGTYSDTVSTIDGCDSIITWYLTVNPVYNQTEELTICQTDLPYTWRDTIFYEETTSGEYVFNKRTTQECDSTVTLTLTVNPVVVMDAVADQQICHGAEMEAVVFGTTLTGGAMTYRWTRDNNNVTGIADAGEGNIPATTLSNQTNEAQTVTFTVKPTYMNNNVSCTGDSITFTVTVNPQVVMNEVADQNICSGSEMEAVTFGTTLTGGTMTYRWTRDNNNVTGIAAAGDGNIPATTLVNQTNEAQTVTFTVKPTYTNNSVSCTGDSITFMVTVNPQVVMNEVADQNICSGSEMEAVTFGTPLTDGTMMYSWTRDNATNVTGIAASSTGNIPATTLVNQTNEAQTVTFTVKPTYTNNTVSCTGDSITFTVMVNPQVVMNEVADQNICSGSEMEAVTFGTTLTGGTMTYRWTRDNNNVTGIAENGEGNISATTLSNQTNEAQMVTFTVKPTYTNNTVSCTGDSITFTVTVNPQVVMNEVGDQNICSGSEMEAVTFGTPLTGGTMTYSWTRDNDNVTGIAASSTGNIPATTLVNQTNEAQTVTFTVKPTYTNNDVSCTGDSITFTVTVNPQVVMNSVDNQLVCSGSEMEAVTFGTTLTGGMMTYSWTRDNTTNVTGIATAGTGDIAATLVNQTNAVQTVNFTVTPSYENNGRSCEGEAITFTVTVNPQVVMNRVDNQLVCSGSEMEAVTFGTTLTGGAMTYRWTRDNDNVTGIAAAGEGNISATTLSNQTNEAQTVTFTVKPTYTNNNNNVSCTGDSITFTVTVYPQVVMNEVADQIICSGEMTSVSFGTTLTDGTMTYNWTRDNNNVTGIAAADTGNIAATLVNQMNEAQTVTFIVQPVYTNGGVGCLGAVDTFTVTVNPQVVMNEVADQVLCQGEEMASVAFSSTITDGNITYSWNRDNTTNVTGIEASGEGDIPTSLLVNQTSESQTVTFTVTPVYTNNGIPCEGSSTFTVTVNPVYDQDESENICDNDLPYTWRDTIFDEETVSGDYVFHSTSVNGCDSVVTLHLTVNHSSTGIDERVACDSFRWINDSIYYESTTMPVYTIRAGNAEGCDSIVTLHLTVNHSSEGDTSAVACGSFDWYEHIGLTESGDYSHVFTNGNANGCDSTVTLHLTVNPTYDVQVEDTIYDSDLPYHYVNGQIDTTFEAGTPAHSTHSFTLSTVNGCDSTVTLTLTVLPCDTIGIIGYEVSDIKVYPNPTSSTINVQLPTATSSMKPEIQLFDIYGQRLQVVTVTGEITKIDLGHYATGVYLLKVVNGDDVIAIRKVIRR